MRRVYYLSTLFLIGFCVLFTTNSCDHVDNPYPPAVDLDTTLYPGVWSEYVANEWPDLDTIFPEMDRNAIIEDFTGHNCSNCPAAATVAHDIHNGNPSRVFIASVHASPTGSSGFQAVTSEYTVDFTNDAGEEYGMTFGNAPYAGFYGNPGGTVNRTLEGPEIFYGSGLWSQKVDEVLLSSLKVAITAHVNYFESTKGLFLHTKVENLDPGSVNDENLGIIVYLIEDSLVAPQNVSSTYTPDYVHRDIMRGTISGLTWGRDVTDGNVVNGAYYLDYSYSVPNQLAPQGQTGAYNAENMHLLIYVYDKVTKEIYQVIEKHIVE